MTKVFVGLLLLMNISPSLSAQAVAAVQNEARSNSGTVVEHISVTFDNTPIKEAIWTIAKRSGTRVLFMGSSVPNKRVTYSATGVTPMAALTAVLNGTNLRVNRTAGGGFELSPVAGKGARGRGIVVGKVTDAKSGKGISGATVSIDNNVSSTTTDDGSFRIGDVAAGNYTVSVRLVGYAKQSRPIIVGEEATIIANFKLEASTNVLDQVVVTGTIAQTELKAVPNAITVITAKQIEERGITRIDQLFRGDIPGLFASNMGPENAFDEVMMYSRGATALNSSFAAGTALGSNAIKTYVDGVQISNPRYLSQIDPKSIERIEILTGPQASTVYGSNAINGVMQIFTKRSTSPRPQLNINLLSGWVENNFSKAKTPQHDYALQLNGIEGKLSYNAGMSWQYMGPWTPAKQSTRTSPFFGARLELPATVGPITADVMYRQGTTLNKKMGHNDQLFTGFRETGWYRSLGSAGLDNPTFSTLSTQTIGVTLGYTFRNIWSHEVASGRDMASAETRYTARGYSGPSDTTLLFKEDYWQSRSMRYTTTLRVPITSHVQTTVTSGADASQNVFRYFSVSPQALVGDLRNPDPIYRQPNHNTGGFLQIQLGLQEQLFLTYGLRAEWNPNFGDDVEPNYAPRYGIAYTQSLGDVSAKLRGSYGRSTRPPTPIAKVATKASQIFGGLTAREVLEYGDFDFTLANPELGPEYQQGGEGGLELYFGSRASLVVTRYNQTVDGLIDRAIIDSIRSLIVNPSVYSSPIDADGYGYQHRGMNVNIGSIRNQGWELQGSTTIGSFSTRGTYSWTKSRVIGIDPRYRRYFVDNPQYTPGAAFQFLPEHTWALEVAYTNAKSRVAINFNGTGELRNAGNDFYYRYLSSTIRLQQNRYNANSGVSRLLLNEGYALADLTSSYQLARQLEGVLQVQNLANQYTNDYWAVHPVIGRQARFGLRWKPNI